MDFLKECLRASDPQTRCASWNLATIERHDSLCDRPRGSGNRAPACTAMGLADPKTEHWLLLPQALRTRNSSSGSRTGPCAGQCNSSWLNRQQHLREDNSSPVHNLTRQPRCYVVVGLLAWRCCTRSWPSLLPRRWTVVASGQKACGFWPGGAHAVA